MRSARALSFVLMLALVCACLSVAPTTGAARADSFHPRVRIATPETFARAGARMVHTDGVVLGVLVPQKSTADTCLIDVLLANRGEEEFHCGETGYLLDCVVKIRTKAGAEAPYTRQGSYLFKNEAGFQQYGYIKYRPLEMRRWRYDLVNAFAPLKSGEYLLSLETTVGFRDSKTKEFSKRVEVFAKDIPFTIREEN